MDGCPSLPIQCVTLDPLYNTPARLAIADILNLQPILGSRSLFVFKTHPINSVDILGLVTSVKRKEDSWACNIDDGTGSIQCFCPLKSSRTSLPSQARLKTLSDSLQKRLSGSGDNKYISLGDFLQVKGPVKISLWNNNKYISNCTWKIVNLHNMDEIWLNSLREQVKLYEEVYSKPFVLNEQLFKSSKSFIEKQVREVLLKNLEGTITNFIQDATNPSVFFGYEILELEEVKQLLSQCFVNAAAEGNAELMTGNDKKNILSSAIAGVLHINVSNGVLVKRKCLQHEIVTNIDQLDARYYITANCKPLLKAVQNAVDLLIKREKPVNPDSVLEVFDDPDFNFLRFTKHGYVAILNALKTLSNHGQG